MRFSIRDVLWLTVVVALAVGWWLSVPPASGRAAGTITVAGKPLTQGHVIFYSLDNGAIVGAKVAAGKYQIPSIPLGKFAVTVDGPGISADYSERKSTYLQYELKDGANTIDLHLE